MAASKVQLCHSLTSYYISAYNDYYGRAPKVNRNRARWSWEAMLMDYSVDELKSLIDFYFETPNNKGHSLDWFLNNYDKLVESKEVSDEESERRAAIREETEKRVKEWRASGRSGVADNQLSVEE